MWVHERVCVGGVYTPQGKQYGYMSVWCVYTPQDKRCGYMSVCVWGVCVHYVWSHICAMEGV